MQAGIFVKPTPDVGRNLQTVQELDEIGVPTVWQTNNVLWPDAMGFYAAVAATTRRIRLGTSIMQIFPRHPAALVSQAQVIESLAPGRLRLGVGTSHRPRMEKNLGIPMGSKPLTYLHEYVTVLRGLLWEGGVEFHGEFFNVSERYPEGTITPPKTEISISALSPKSYHMAGEIADAAISWMAPIRYLVETGLPGLQAGADEAGRPVPPLIAHVPVSVTTDRERAIEASRRSRLLRGAAVLPADVREGWTSGDGRGSHAGRGAGRGARLRHAGRDPPAPGGHPCGGDRRGPDPPGRGGRRRF